MTPLVQSMGKSAPTPIAHLWLWSREAGGFRNIGWRQCAAAAFLLAIAGLSKPTAAQAADSTTATPHKFLKMLQEIVRLGDLRNHEGVGKVLDLSLSPLPLGTGIRLQPGQSFPWIRGFSYDLFGNESLRLRERLYVSLRPNVLCITLDDVWSKFGKDYAEFSVVHHTHFRDPEAAEEYRRGLVHNIWGFTYLISSPSLTELSFSFQYRKCLDNAEIKVTLGSTPQ